MENNTKTLLISQMKRAIELLNVKKSPNKKLRERLKQNTHQHYNMIGVKNI